MRVKNRELERRLRERIRVQGKAKSTANNYWHWFDRYLKFSGSELAGEGLGAEAAAERFLTYLANRLHVSANTQNQALSALCYMYREVLDRPLVGVSAVRSKRPDRVRDVCDQSELRQVFARLSGVNLLACRMMYGAGLRIGELPAIRIKDLSFERRQIHIWGAKGAKDRVVQFPEVLHDGVRHQVESVREIWKSDVAAKRNGVSLPFAWGRKSPSSRLDFGWYYLLPSDHYSRCPDTGESYRHHRDMGGVSKALKKAVRESGVTKRITAHCLRHSNGTHFLEDGNSIHVLKELFGHKSIETTQTYAHVRKDGATAARSPLESMEGSGTDDQAVSELVQKLSQLLSSPKRVMEIRENASKESQDRATIRINRGTG